ncbi:MAG: BON domain-containing protein [Pseudomonadota bacterium]
MKSSRNIFAALLAVVMFALAGCAATPKTESTAEYVDDTVITGKVKAVFVNDPALKAREINVETFKGVVQLSGFVSSEADAQRAVAVTKGIKGVVSVKNDMRIK